MKQSSKEPAAIVQDLGAGDFVDVPTTIICDVHVARLIFAKAANAIGGVAKQRILPSVATALQAPESSAAVVSIEINAIHIGIILPTVDSTTSDRATL